MKTLLAVRHAKSSWDDSSMEDIDRPLNERGKADAPEMAKRLIKENVKIDVFLSSPAKRARKTAALFMQEFNLSKDELIIIDQLYNAHAEDFFKIVKGFDEAWETAAVFSHNPGITDFVNSLTSIKIDNMPTAGVFAVKLNLTRWEDLEKNSNEFLFFNHPKLAL